MGLEAVMAHLNPRRSVHLKTLRKTTINCSPRASWYLPNTSLGHKYSNLLGINLVSSVELPPPPMLDLLLLLLLLLLVLSFPGGKVKGLTLITDPHLVPRS
jgi:hypothetical protein